MNRIQRCLAVLAGLGGALLTITASAPAALAVPPPPVPESPVPVTIHTVVSGGMSGWQITLIAVGAALLAATVTVLADRARASRRKAITAAA
jgi:hypothetical protein